MCNSGEKGVQIKDIVGGRLPANGGWVDAKTLPKKQGREASKRDIRGFSRSKRARIEDKTGARRGGKPAWQKKTKITGGGNALAS